MPKVINPACAIALNAYAESSTHQLLAGFAPNLNATLALNWGSAFVLPSSSAEATTSNRSNMPALSPGPLAGNQWGSTRQLQASRLRRSADGQAPLHRFGQERHCGTHQEGSDGHRSELLRPSRPSHIPDGKSRCFGKGVRIQTNQLHRVEGNPRPLGKPLLQRMPCRHRIEQRSIAVENHRINHSISFPSMRGYVPQEPSAPAATV